MGNFYYHTAASAAQCCRLSTTGRTGHPRAPTRGSILQSTTPFTDPAIAMRPLWHSAVNLPRACRAGQVRQ